MSDSLKQTITDIQKSFIEDPSLALEVFKSESVQKDGLYSEVSIREHALCVDEPENLGGTDRGPNPVELVLAALGTCQEITYRAYATAMDIPLESVSVKLEGHIDLRGFFGVDDSVRPGYNAIKGTVNIVSAADAATIETLRGAVNAHCPVLDIITKPVPVELVVDLKEPSKAAAE